MGLLQAVVQGASTRLRPVLMTALTTISALIPMALSKSQGAELRSPLAISMIGGLACATLLTLFVIPIFYMLFSGKKEVEAKDL